MAKAAAVKKAPAAPADGEAEEVKSKSPSMKLVIIIALLMGLVGSGAGFAIGYSSFMKGGETEGEKAADHGADPAKEAGAEGEHKPAKEGEAPKEGGDHGEAPKEAGAHGEAPAEGAADAKPAEGGHGEAPAEGGHGEAGAEGEAAGPHAVTLDPVVINIASPTDVWVRLETVLKTTETVSKEVTDQIHEDYMTFFHTMRLQDLQGPSAYIDLKSELIARANSRADGKIESVYIKTFLFE